MKNNYQISGTNSNALFSLTLHRGEGMTLLGMNWKKGKPPINFVGFAIEYKEPGGKKFYALNNRLSFPGADAKKDPTIMSTLHSPIQKFRWVHFPFKPEIPGSFTYRVTPVFMDDKQVLSYGDPQTADIILQRETYPGQLNVAFTRGFISSQAFVDRFLPDGPISKLIPAKADNGLKFKATHKDAKVALPWMGFEAYSAIIELLDQAIADEAEVRVIAYDFNEPEIIDRLKKLGTRLKVIIDNSGSHKPNNSAESQAEKILIATAGRDNVLREHMGNLQHNKTIIVKGTNTKAALCGSTNLSWRGFFVQNNNAVIITGENPVKIFSEAFDNFWQYSKVKDFAATSSSMWNKMGLSGIDAKISFSPHVTSNALLQEIADDITKNATSSVLYSLAFLYQSPGAVHDAVKKVTNNKKLFVYGISDKPAGGILVKSPGNINPAPVYPSALGGKNLPEPFRSEPTGGGGTRMHHKFIVLDFNKPTARVYFGSYNFSNPADLKNGENLVLVKDRRIATSYMIEALRIFDHYEFRVVQNQGKKAKKKLELTIAPIKKSDKPWWHEDYNNPIKIQDRLLFA